MRKIALLLAGALTLGACGWDYSAVPEEEVPDNDPDTAIENPPECFTIQVNQGEGWGLESTTGIGRYCRVEDDS